MASLVLACSSPVLPGSPASSCPVEDQVWIEAETSPTFFGDALSSQQVSDLSGAVVLLLVIAYGLKFVRKQFQQRG